MRKVSRGTPKPTHGDGMTATSTLEPQKCRECGAELEVVEMIEELTPSGVEAPKHDEVACPNGCEECL